MATETELLRLERGLQPRQRVQRCRLQQLPIQAVAPPEGVRAAIVHPLQRTEKAIPQQQIGHGLHQGWPVGQQHDRFVVSDGEGFSQALPRFLLQGQPMQRLQALIQLSGRQARESVRDINQPHQVERQWSQKFPGLIHH